MRKFTFLKMILLAVVMAGSMDVFGATETVTIDLTAAGGTSNLGSGNYGGGTERTWTISGIDFGGKAITAGTGTNAGKIQAQANSGVIYNKTPFPGRIVKITLNQSGTAVSSAYGGSSVLVNSIAADYTVTGGSQIGAASATGWTSTDFTSTNYLYFAIKRGATAAYFSSIEIEYETSSTLPSISTNLTSIDFGNINVDNTSAPKAITVTGSNLTTAPTYSVDNTAYAVTGTLDTSGGTLNVTFTPSTTGLSDGVLTITGNGISTMVDLIGNGIIDTPIATAATGISQTGFTANWDAAAGAASYDLNVYTKEDGTVKASDLFISEYGEGSGNNKYIEIYNGTGGDVDLSQYTLKQAINGGGWDMDISYTLPLTGTIANDKTYVIANDGASSTIKDVADLIIVYNNATQGGRVVSFTGNDAMGLFKNGTLIDVFGDPTSSATIPVAGYSTYGQDRTHVRKSTITQGNTDWVSSSGTDLASSEWLPNAQDTWTFIGSHDMMGGASILTPVTGSPFTTSSTSYDVTGLNNSETYYYSVVAKRDAEVSPESNEIGPISLTATGLSTLKSDAQAWTSQGKVMVHASAGESIEVFTMTGQKVISKIADEGLNTISLSAQGVLIVKAGNRVSKVIN